MLPFRRKKSDKSFPVRVMTFDSELEFKLEVKQFINKFMTNVYNKKKNFVLLFN